MVDSSKLILHDLRLIRNAILDVIVRHSKVENMTEVLKRARSKKIFAGNEFAELLAEIQSADSSLELDWDFDAGEEWARFFSRENGTVCMMNAKIGVTFIRKAYEFSNIEHIVGALEIVFTENYSSEDWFIDLADLEQNVPEICWHASEEAVNPTCISLDDLYFATV
ncbi:hypothetical protein [Adlercreutzia sp. ZJ304]|uniref:hypothetical protein n=1 Tax=Adlercreutzia sp. ZJ304 TaxID=2709791 RepID=UPI0013EA1733|nr:hypothetical protein [Adlercreutzia sp. ZJ304]